VLGARAAQVLRPLRGGALPIATEALQRIGALYAVERDIRGSLPAQRAASGGSVRATARRVARLARRHPARRCRRSRTWPGDQVRAGALAALTRYCDDGRIEIDNNSAERSIRPVVLGRRNYLFAGSDAGGERAPCIYSLIGTALLNDRDPYLYCAMCSSGLPSIRSTASASCCLAVTLEIPAHAALEMAIARKAPRAPPDRRADLPAAHRATRCQPAIWRRILVPGSIKLHQLHARPALDDGLGRADTCTSS